MTHTQTKSSADIIKHSGFSADVALNASEMSLFKRVLATKPKCLLSFGIGESIIQAAISGVRSIVAIDSVPDKVRTMTEHPDIKPLIESGHAAILHSDLGKVNEWGNPTDASNIQNWPRYILSAWDECTRLNCVPDVVHVRGRFRVACGLSVGLAWPEPSGYGSAGSPLVIFNDMCSGRPHYDPICDFYDYVARADSLVVGRWKLSAQRAFALSAFVKFQFDPR